MYGKQHGLITIWDIWGGPKSPFMKWEPYQLDNPMRCIIAEDIPEKSGNRNSIRQRYFSTMSEAMASMCSGKVTFMDRNLKKGTYGRVKQAGIWGKIEFPRLRKDGKTTSIDAIGMYEPADLDTQITWPNWWVKGDTTWPNEDSKPEGIKEHLFWYARSARITQFNVMLRVVFPYKIPFPSSPGSRASKNSKFGTAKDGFGKSYRDSIGSAEPCLVNAERGERSHIEHKFQPSNERQLQAARQPDRATFTSPAESAKYRGRNTIPMHTFAELYVDDKATFKISQLEMGEHVGLKRLTAFFGQCYDMLAGDRIIYVQPSGLQPAWQYKGFI
ncbi:hypothetical protein DPSP01_010584 [Paraphaeosphaeria sporulosa]